MKHIIKMSTLAFFLLLASFISMSQKKWLQPGDQMPDVILNDVSNYPGGHARISDFRGKILIFDCWSHGCSGCIAAFPRMEKLQEQFKDRIQIFTLTKVPKEQIDDFFSGNGVIKPHGRRSLLPSLMGDTAITGLFRPYLTVPEHIWVDGNGKVLYITHGYNTTAGHIQAVLDGAHPFLLEKVDITSNTLDDKTLAAYVTNRAPDHVKYSSFFTGYSAELSSLYSMSKHIDSVHQLFRVDYMNYSPLDLIREAFRAGRKGLDDNFYDENRIEWKVKDRAVFIRPKNYDSMDSWKKQNTYNYEQVIPLKEEPRRYQLMQEDVNRYFKGVLGIEAKVVTIQKKCLVLGNIGKGIQKAKGDQPEQELSSKIGVRPEWLQFINIPFRNVVEGLHYSYEGLLKDQPYPFIDETGFTGNADLKYDLSATSITELNQQLSHYGLKIILADRWIKMVQIEKTKDYAKQQ